MATLLSKGRLRTPRHDTFFHKGFRWPLKKTADFGIPYKWTIGNNGGFVYGYAHTSHNTGGYGDLNPKDYLGEPVYLLTANTSSNLGVLSRGVNPGGIVIPGVFQVKLHIPSFTPTDYVLLLNTSNGRYEVTDSNFVSQVVANDGNTIDIQIANVVNQDLRFIIKTTTPDEVFTIPTVAGYSYNCRIFWGDNTHTDLTTADAPKHTYNTPGEYSVSILGVFQTIRFDGDPNGLLLISIENLGVIDWSNGLSAFKGCSNILKVTAGVTDFHKNIVLTGAFNGLTNVTEIDLSTMLRPETQLLNTCFQNNSNLQTIKLPREFINEHTTNAFALFTFCDALTTITNLDSWNGLNLINAPIFYRTSLANPNDYAVALDWSWSKVTSASSILNTTTLDTVNYDLILSRLAAQSPNLQNGVNFGAQPTKYTDVDSRNILTGVHNWNITDGGPVNLPQPFEAFGGYDGVSLWGYRFGAATLPSSNLVAFGSINPTTIDGKFIYRITANDVNDKIVIGFGDFGDEQFGLSVYLKPADEPGIHLFWDGTNKRYEAPNEISMSTYLKNQNNRVFFVNITPSQDPIVGVDTQGVDFGTVIIGSSSNQIPVTISNVGNGVMTGITYTATDPEVVVTGPMPTTLNPGENTSVNLQYTPTITETINGEFHVESNAQSSPDIVPYTGVAIVNSAQILSDQTIIDFNTFHQGTNPQVLFTVTNTGGSDLVISGVVFDFPELTVDAIPPAIPSGQSASFNVICTQTAVQRREGTMTVQSNAINGDLVAEYRYASVATGNPIISNDVITPGTTTIDITFDTDTPCENRIEYDTDPNFGTIQQTNWTGSLVTSQVAQITGLNSNTQYYIRLKARDGASNQSLDTRKDVKTLISVTTVTWMEDQGTDRGSISLAPVPPFNYDNPRLSTGSMKQDMTADELSKYDMACAKMTTSRITTIGQAQAINPNLAFFRIICPQEYQGYSTGPNNESQGMPFAGTGPISGVNNEMYAGHWAYFTPTTTTASMNTTQTTVTVADTTKVANGYYVCIYDTPLGSFNNPEHCKVTAINGNTLTLERAFKSNAVAHASGSIVVQHAPGSSGTNPLNWIYNLSTRCPLDGAGKKFNEVLAEWHSTHYYLDKDGNPQGLVRVDGVLYDSDFHYMSVISNRNLDLDNDGVKDLGQDPNTGENFWGDGLEYFYTRTRELTPVDIVKIGGDTKNFGFGGNNGTQLENFPVDSLEPTGNPAYVNIDRQITAYKYHAISGTYLPRINDVHNKCATDIYPAGLNPQQGNRPFRLAFGFSLLFDGYLSMQNYPDGGAPGDRWYDEYAVDIATGQAIDKTDYAGCRANRGWLGPALGNWFRVYDVNQFSQELFPNGDFAQPLSGWSGVNVTVVERDVTTAIVGAFSLHVGPHTTYQSKIYNASVRGPSVSVVAGQTYTLGFAVKSPKPRQIQARLGSYSQKLFIPDDWFRVVLQHTFTASASAQVRFDIGTDDDDIWFDDIHVVQGTADIFRRNFTNGIVIVNATPTQQVVTLGGSYKRISGTQDPINDGSALGATVTIDPYDSAILLNA